MMQASEVIKHISIGGIGAGFGSALRALFTIVIAPLGCISSPPITSTDYNFPIATFISNLLGAFILGCVGRLGTNGRITIHTTLFFGAGFCGGLTTFSSYAVEILLSLHYKWIGQAIIYFISTQIGGLLVFAISWYITNYYFPKKVIANNNGS